MSSRETSPRPGRAGKRAHELSLQADAPALVGRIEIVLAQTDFLDGAFEEAVERLESARERFREHSDVADLVKVDFQLGRVYRSAGEQRRAERCIRAGAERARKHGLDGQLMRAQLQLGLMYAELEEFEDALGRLERE